MKATIYFVTTDEDGEELPLAKAKLPYVLRAGETVILHNLRLREDEHLPLSEQRTMPQTVVFEVQDVSYEFDAYHTIGKTEDIEGFVESVPATESEVELKVWLALPPFELTPSFLKRKGS